MRSIYLNLKFNLSLDDGRIIPAGVDLTLNLAGILKDPTYFNDPETFLPERFDKNEHKIPPLAFIPFSIGPRGCIGQKFAMLTIKVALIRLLQHFEFYPLGEEPTIIGFSFLSDKIQLGLRRRIQINDVNV